MDAHLFSRRQVFCYRLLSILVAITMIYPTLALSPASADTGPRPGATDLAASYAAKWPDGEIFVTTPQLDSGRFGRDDLVPPVPSL